MRSDARRLGDRQGHTRSHIGEKSLMPARSDRSQPGQSLHRIWSIKASSVMVLRGEYPPQPQTTISNQVCNANTEKSSVCQPRALSPSELPA